MKASQPVLDALEQGHRVRIALHQGDGLEEGRRVFDAIQADCSFPLLYIQQLGGAPVIVIWRGQSVSEGMREHGTLPPCC
jgi:hypothetical protein